MELNQTFYIFLAESIIFIIILVLCLVKAADKHRGQIREVLEQVNKSQLFIEERQSNERDARKLIDSLKSKISKLQQQIGMLEKFELSYYELQDKYDTDITDLRNQLKNQDYRKEKDTNRNSGFVIKVGTTIDREKGVDPAYFDYLSKKQLLNNVASAATRSTHESKVLEKKIREQRETIESLKKSIKDMQLEKEIGELKGNSVASPHKTLDSLEKSLLDAQTQNNHLEKLVSEFKHKLNDANNKISTMEMKDEARSRNDGSHKSGGDSDIIIRSALVNNDKTANTSTDGEYYEVMQFDYEKIKKEVTLLRKNTTQQRQLILTLEKEMSSLKEGLNDDSLSNAEAEEREQHIKNLEKVLRETEVCVEVLESEVSFLQDKLTAHAEGDSENTLRGHYNNKHLELERMQAMLNNALRVRASLSDIIRLGTRLKAANAIEHILKGLVNIFEYLEVDVYVKVVSHIGTMESKNTSGISAAQVADLDANIQKHSDTLIETEDGFICCTSKIGAYIKAPFNAETSLGKIKDTSNFILLVANSAIVHIEEKQSAYVRQNALRNLVDAIRKKISAISVQSRYQSEEAKNIFDGLVQELNSMFKTISVSKTQDEFFHQMIDETQQRMSLLLESEVVVDKAFNELLDRIEKSTKVIGRR